MKVFIYLIYLLSIFYLTSALVDKAYCLSKYKNISFISNEIKNIQLHKSTPLLLSFPGSLYSYI